MTIELITKPITQLGLYHHQFQHFIIAVFPGIIINGISTVSFLLNPTSTPKFGMATASIATLVLTATCPYINKEEASRHTHENKNLRITIFNSL